VVKCQQSDRKRVQKRITHALALPEQGKRNPNFETSCRQSAKDINNLGEITGRAIDSTGVRAAYLAVPK
jgi:hypothetical protein